MSKTMFYLGARKSVLDILVLWENYHLMPEFNSTHIGYARELSSPQLLAIIELCSEGLRLRNHMVGKNGALKLAPLCTQFIKAVKRGDLQSTVLKLLGKESKETAPSADTRGEKRKAKALGEVPSLQKERKKTWSDVRRHGSRNSASTSERVTELSKHPGAENEGGIDVEGSMSGMVDLEELRKTLKEKKKTEKALLKEIELLKSELRNLRKDRRVTRSGTRRLSITPFEFSLNTMSRADLSRMKTEIERRLNKITQE
ncbi:hypothetical protein FGB62_481g05 [Gracilaria domingensis]|nr:hypothetical protein FGB62_481g05 [Gracilaria domingensis]